MNERELRPAKAKPASDDLMIRAIALLLGWRDLKTGPTFFGISSLMGRPPGAAIPAGVPRWGDSLDSAFLLLDALKAAGRLSSFQLSDFGEGSVLLVLETDSGGHTHHVEVRLAGESWSKAVVRAVYEAIALNRPRRKDNDE